MGKRILPTPTPPAAPVISGKEGMLRVQVVCDSTDTGHRDKKENLRLRDVQNGITEYAPGEVIKSSKDGYDWQYTVTLYKSDFATRFQHNSGNDHEYVSDTKDSVDVTFYYRDGAWDFEKSQISESQCGDRLQRERRRKLLLQLRGVPRSTQAAAACPDS